VEVGEEVSAKGVHRIPRN